MHNVLYRLAICFALGGGTVEIGTGEMHTPSNLMLRIYNQDAS